MVLRTDDYSDERGKGGLLCMVFGYGLGLLELQLFNY